MRLLSPSYVDYGVLAADELCEVSTDQVVDGGRLALVLRHDRLQCLLQTLREQE